MDTLSTLLADIRIRDARFVRACFDLGGQLDVLEAGQPCFHMVTKGRLWLRPAEEQPPIALQAGDVAFYPQGHAHALCGQALPRAGLAQTLQQHLAPAAAGPTSILHLPVVGTRAAPAEGVGRSISGCMHIDGVAQAWLLGALPPVVIVKWSERALPDWLQIGLAYLEQELERDQLARQAIINRLGDILFIQSLRSYVEEQPAGSWLMGLKDDMISKVLGAMHRDPARPWALQDLARAGCVSRSVLADRFKELIGQAPLGYLTRHRMHLAARRLRDTNLSVAEVAAMVGYSSAMAFSQAFKREFGCSPRAYRLQTD
jgi:AraC-like DNA-binding protein